MTFRQIDLEPVLNSIEASSGETVPKVALLNVLRSLAARSSFNGQAKKITQTTASPFAVVFSNLNMQNMADGNYQVIIGGETKATVLESSQSPTGFTLIGGNIGDVIHVVIFSQT